MDEHLTTYENPFKFSGKELDDITGLYDHGARSRNPISTLWYGIDTLWEKSMDVGLYNYCYSNPIMLNDLTGKKDKPYQEGVNKPVDKDEIMQTKTPVYNYKTEKKIRKHIIVILMHGKILKENRQTREMLVW